MITDVLMPQMGLEVNEATVLEVLVSRGAQVAEAAPLIELETDKATTEVTAPRAGHVIAIEVAPGDVVQVGAVLARIADEAEESQSEPASVAPRPCRTHARWRRATRHDGLAGAAGAGDGRLRAAPVARRAAQRARRRTGVRDRHGSPGRITLADVERAAAAASPATAPGAHCASSRSAVCVARSRGA